MGGDVVVDRSARQCEQRAHVPGATHRDACEARGPGAAHDPHEDGLRLVACRVAEKHDREAELVGDGIERGVASVARGGLDRGARLDIHAADHGSGALLARPGHHAASDRTTARLEAVIDGDDDHVRGPGRGDGGVGQRHRIGPTRAGHAVGAGSDPPDRGDDRGADGIYGGRATHANRPYSDG